MSVPKGQKTVGFAKMYSFGSHIPDCGGCIRFCRKVGGFFRNRESGFSATLKNKGKSAEQSVGS
jgi:hypothetical protein